MTYLLQFYAAQILFVILRMVPLKASGWVLRRAANIFFFCSPKRRKSASDNLNIAYGDTLSDAQKGKIVWMSFENGALSILELFLIKKIKKSVSNRFSIMGKESYEKAAARGKGIIFVASHLGSWEYIGFAAYITGFPTSVIVKKLKNKYLNKTIDDLRREINTVPIPKVNAIRQTLSELKKNHGVAVVIDQWAGDEGIWIDFFGKATSTTSLPVRLAKQTGCALIPIYCLRKEIGRYEIQMLPEVALADGPDWEIRTTRRLNEILESQIRKYPEQWFWGHRRWKQKPLTIRTV